MAQAVYSTFCTAFPTSYKQFGDEFKEDLSQLITEWIAGLCSGSLIMCLLGLNWFCVIHQRVSFNLRNKACAKNVGQVELQIPGTQGYAKG